MARKSAIDELYAHLAARGVKCRVEVLGRMLASGAADLRGLRKLLIRDYFYTSTINQQGKRDSVKVETHPMDPVEVGILLTDAQTESKLRYGKKGEGIAA